MEKTKIRMYLVYWFEQDVGEEEVSEALRGEEGIRCRFIRTKGGTGVEFFDVREETWDLERVTDAFLSECGPFVGFFNRFSEKFEGFYRVEIVPEMYGREKAALVFDRKFADFLLRLKKWKDIDVDQYMYW